MKIRYRLFCVLVAVCVFAPSMLGQAAAYDPSVFIDININTGNPTFPYPQFLEYKGGGKSLAKYNAEGVTHADMEKAGREAYEIMMHRCRYMGGTHCGVPYITFNHDDVPGNYGTFVSEGDGYAMLAAAIFADQKTFNGLYMWVHDNRMSGVKRFKDGTTLRADLNDYAGPYLAGWKNDETTASMSPSHSATDGDVDIAMAMLIAYKQWGEWMIQDGQIVKDSEGNQISLKEEAYRVITALVDTMAQWDKGSGLISGYISGDIGIDGYCKKGNSWGELTRWRFSDAANAQYPGMNGPYNGGPNLLSQYGTLWIDYDAPSYFDEFYRWFKNGDGGVGKNVDWQISQFQRAAASGNYLNREAYKQGYIASIGNVTIGDDGSNPQFNVYVDGEDFRYAWRHLVDYLWHGNQQYDWDPATHQVIAGTNSSEYDMAIRHAEMLKNPKEGSDLICSKMGASPDPGQPQWFGVSQIPQQWRFDGGITSPYHTNYSVGSGSPAAVISEDLELLADIYRQCEIAWDGNNTAAKLDPEERYIGSTPKYFHGWFRTLGMLVCSGNYAAPEDMKPIANMKVYMSVDKTYAYQGDKIDYTVQYRNYGTVKADGVTITTELDPNYEFVSANKGGVLSGNKIVWNIGSVQGFKTGGLDATIDSVSFTVIAKDTLNPRICLTSTISGSNFDDWVSNEYPNHATYTMERNCVDILANRSLYIEKTANRTSLNPKDVVTFTVEFGNKSEGEASWMNGGRDNVRISYGNYYMSGSAYQFYQLYRFWNDSHEAYINMNNYRVSYFMSDAAAVGLYDASKNPTGWTFVVDNQNDLDKYGYNPESGSITFAYQKIPVGEDEHGKWNQRLMIRFADVLMAPTTHVYDKLDSDYLLHKGVRGPGFIRARLASNPNADLTTRVKDDWSFSSDVTESSLDGQGTTFTLISPCWANYDDPGYVIDNYARHVCSPTSVKNYERILVEEFDGYTWRRIQGTGPLPGKEAYNVTITDTIPYELEWVGWKDSTALKDDAGNRIQAKYTAAANPKSAGYTGIVHWTIPVMLVGENDKLVYTCKARDLGCPDVEDTYYENVAWIWSDTDSPDSSKVDLMTTCAELPPVIDPQTSLTKKSSVDKAETGDAISYELKFKNTEGTRVDANCGSITGWQALGSGSLPAVGDQGLKLSTTGSGAYFFAPEKSYGKDGSVYLTIGGSPSSTQSLFLVMRYVSGTPGTASFKGVCMQLMVNKDGKNNFGYYLYNDGTLIASEGLSWADAMQYPGNNESPTFKFVLNGDHLYMYVNDQEEEWTTVSKDWTGLTSNGPGYFGMYVNSNGNSSTQLTSFITELDYAFDITLYDDLPEELGNITNISDGGVYDATKNYITWPTIAKTTATALAPNDSVVYTFDAEVVSCGNYINNYGLATVYGLDTLKVLNTVECGAVECALDTILISVNKSRICVGDSTVLKAKANPKGAYRYEYFRDDVLLKATKADSIWIGESGEYMVKVYDIEDDACFKESEPVTLTVDTVPVLNLGADVTLCAGEKATVKSNVVVDAYEWSDASTEDSLVVDKKGTYWLTVTAGACSVSDTVQVDMVDALVADLGNDTTICYGQTMILDGGTATEYEWSNGETTPTLEVGETGEYILKLMSGSCSASDTIVVTVADEIKLDLGDDQSLCQGESATLDAGIADSYEWSTGETTSTIEVDTDGEYRVKVTVGECVANDTVNLTFGTANLIGGGFTLDGVALTEKSVSVCPGTQAILATTYVTDAGTDYTWTSVPTDAALQGNGSEASIAPAEKTTYYVHFTKKCEAVDSIVVDIASPMVVTVKTDTLCGSTMLTASTTGSADAEFEWSIKGETAAGTGAAFLIEKETAESGTAVVTATAPDACTSEPLEVPFSVVDLSLVMDGSPSVCPGGTTEVTVIPTSTEVAPAYVYTWKKNGVSQTETGATMAASPGTYEVTVRTAYCEKTSIHTVTEGSGELKGRLSINGNTLYGMPKEYGTCGEELTIVADYVTTGTAGFLWSEGNGTTNTLTLQPNSDMEIYLQFENECMAYDTIKIMMLDSVHATIAETRTCGLTTLTATADAQGAKYVWAEGVDTTFAGKLELAAGTTAGGTVALSANADGYCPSRTQTYAYTVDTLSVSVDGDAKVCMGGDVALTATVGTSVTTGVSGQWSARKKGGTFAPLTEMSTTLLATDIRSDMEYEYMATAGTCTESARFSVELLTPVRDGHFMVDGVAAGADKRVRICKGASVDVAVDHTATDEASFAWSVEPADGTMIQNGRTMKATPEVTTQYVVSYENDCKLKDTLTVEVSTLNVTVDWSGMGTEMCEGGSSSARMELHGYDQTETDAYMYWTKDGVEMSDTRNVTELSMSTTKPSDSGVYGWRVSNGVCTDSSTATTEHKLFVKPYITFTADAYEYEVGRGGDVTMTINPTPSTASVAWDGTDAGVAYTKAGVMSDFTVAISMTAVGYCPADTQMTVRVDGKPVISATADKNKMCLGEEVVLTGDTTGTGHLLHPQRYEVEWQAKTQGGTYAAISTGKMMEAQKPSVTTTYRMKVTYGTETIYSEEMEVLIYEPATYAKDAKTTICEGSSVETGISGLLPTDATVVWAADGSITSGTDDQRLTVSPTKSTAYKFTVKREIGCQITDSVLVDVQKETVLNLPADTSVCEGSGVTLAARADGVANSYVWTETTTGGVMGNTSVMTAKPMVDVTYKVTVDAGVCGEKTGEVRVFVSPMPRIAKLETLKLRDVEITADGGTEPYEYKVAADGTYGSDNVVSVKKYTVYDFYVRDYNGCETKRPYKVEAPGIVIEDYFTPDGDGVKDNWEVVNLAEAYPDAVVAIYDRFGKKLCEMKASEGSWDGTYNGKAMPSTDYWYEINIPEIDKMYVGHFTLLRR